MCAVVGVSLNVCWCGFVFLCVLVWGYVFVNVELSLCLCGFWHGHDCVC